MRGDSDLQFLDEQRTVDITPKQVDQMFIAASGEEYHHNRFVSRATAILLALFDIFFACIRSYTGEGLRKRQPRGEASFIFQRYVILFLVRQKMVKRNRGKFL